MISRRSFSSVTRALFAANKSAASGGPKKPANSPSSKKPDAACDVPKETKNDSYQAPEYFAHNKFSFVEEMVNLSKYRLPQKSNKVPSA